MPPLCQLLRRLARRKHLLSSYHKRKHLGFAKCYRNLDWTQVLWSDGTKMTLLSITSKGPGNIVRIHGIMDSIKYHKILDQYLAASARRLKVGCGWIFQQDNDPKQTSIFTQKWFTDHRIKVVQW
ncbi:hypothetical protein SKAU_G00306880, partial [Synaphobranchus kaupii]